VAALGENKGNESPHRAFWKFGRLCIYR